MKRALIIFLGLFAYLCANGQSPVWDISLGESGAESGKSVVFSQDRIYMASYYTPTIDDPENPVGVDILVSALNTDGLVIWSKTMGGTGDDDPFGILKTGEGNILIIGSTNSEDGVFSEGKGGTDGFVIKMDASGKQLWTKQFGGAGDDFILSGTVSESGELFLAGFTESDDQGMTGHGLLDGWLLKISSSGDLLWQKSYGGSYNDFLRDVDLTNDGRLVACGYTRSADGDIEGFSGIPNGSANNGWVVMLNTEGEILHQHCFGQTDSVDVAFSSIQVGEDGQILLGGEISEVINSHFNGNYRMMLAVYSGTLELDSSLVVGGTGNYVLNDILQEESGDLYLVGSWNNQGAGIFDPFGQTDQYVVKLRHDFEFVWEYYSGIEGLDKGLSAAFDSGDKLIIAGSRDKSAHLTKLNPQLLIRNEVYLCPGDSIWINGSNVSEEGVFYDTLVSEAGIDSLVMYHLMMKSSYHFESGFDNLCNMELVLHDSIIRESGDYYFSYETDLGCDSIYSYTLDFLITDNRVEVEGAKLTAYQSGASYQWVDCSDNQAIEGAVDRSFVAKESGNYKVRIDVLDCLLESDCYQVYATAFFNEELKDVKIYPNPAGSYVIVSLDKQEIKSIILTDMMGSVRASYKGSGQQMELDVSELPGGLYMLQLKTEFSILNKRILKR